MAESPSSLPVVLTIAGSDSGAGAGIQADLKTFCSCGVYGVTAVTCVTAQSPGEILAVEPVSADGVKAQIAAVMAAFPLAAVKTGMLYAADIVVAVADALHAAGRVPLVVDPVMVATSGRRLLAGDAVQALTSALLPRARIVTPNIPEAEVLAEQTIRSVDEMAQAAQRIHDRFGCACVVKGGHLADGGRCVVNQLCEGQGVVSFETERLDVGSMHGTGCTFSAALAAALAKGALLEAAVGAAQAFVSHALNHAVCTGNYTHLGQQVAFFNAPHAADPPPAARGEQTGHWPCEHRLHAARQRPGQ